MRLTGSDADQGISAAGQPVDFVVTDAEVDRWGCRDGVGFEPGIERFVGGAPPVSVMSGRSRTRSLNVPTSRLWPTNVVTCRVDIFGFAALVDLVPARVNGSARRSGAR